MSLLMLVFVSDWDGSLSIEIKKMECMQSIYGLPRLRIKLIDVGNSNIAQKH